MKLALLILLCLITCFIFLIKAGKIVNADKYKIRSKTGIQKVEYISTEGIIQYIQIRGQNISNPVIIMLHGGPGSNMASYSYHWQSSLEKEYTIVHWDQRGCGNTFYSSDIIQKPTLDILLSDLDDLVEHICEEYSKEKVIIMGHSWGTFLGAIYSKKYAQKVAAYVSISQMLDFKKSEQISAQEAIRLANKASKYHDVRKIEQKLGLIMDYQKFNKQEAMDLMKLRQLKEKYLPPQYPNKMFLLRLFSPYMTLNNLKWMFSFNKLIEANSELYRELLSGKKQSINEYGLHYMVPVIMVAGDRDWTTPYCLSLQYFNDISAPYKKFLTIKDAGHIPFLDKPEEFSGVLLNALHNV